MRIECLEDRLSDVDPDTGRHYLLAKGDTITVPDAYGTKLCGHGWVRDLDGKVKTAARSPGAQIVKPDKVVVKPVRGNRG